GPIAGVLLAGPLPRSSQFDAAMSAIFLPILALRLWPKPPRPLHLGGARWASTGDLRPHEIPTWPAPSQHVSAGTSWQGASNPESRPTVNGVEASREGRHTLLVVPTGLGKGLWTVTQLLTWNGSVIVNDLKGDIYRQTAGWRQTLGPVYVLSVD